MSESVKLESPVLVKLTGTNGGGGGVIVRTEQELLDVVKLCLFRKMLGQVNAVLTLEVNR